MARTIDYMSRSSAACAARLGLDRPSAVVVDDLRRLDAVDTAVDSIPHLGPRVAAPSFKRS